MNNAYKLELLCLKKYKKTSQYDILNPIYCANICVKHVLLRMLTMAEWRFVMMSNGLEDRKYWVEILERIARPVLSSLSERRLKKVMPVEAKIDDRDKVTYLEALGRTLVGISPWLETGPRDGAEGILREEYANMARKAIDAATDPDSADFMNFTGKFGNQPAVDAAFLSHAILRAPTELYEKLDNRVKVNLLNAIKSTRECKIGFSNWLLFAAMIETFLCFSGEKWDHMRVDYAIRQHAQWYKGDGAYGDGPNFHWDYYNSFVIQPMLVDVLIFHTKRSKDWEQFLEPAMKNAIRYAEVLERMISPEGTYPPIGRSLAYRFGAFQHLSQMALQKSLPDKVTPSQVRCALTAVIKRIMDAPNTFDEKGWLKIGLCGAQPGLGETYISTGSLYLCSAVLLPLGLLPEDEFWSGEPKSWTAKKVWMGEDLEEDHALTKH